MNINPLSRTVRAMPQKQILAGLSRFQRILLMTDGTVTELVQQYLEDKINIVRWDEYLSEDRAKVTPAHQAFVNDELGEEASQFFGRKVLLQGESTQKNWIYAESTILVDRLKEGFRADLLAFKEPIGRLWEKYRCETYKSMLDFEQKPAGDVLAKYFDVTAETTVISRTYSVYSNAKLIMIITEVFPNTFFCD